MSKMLFLTVLIAWGENGATKDSGFPKPFASEAECLSVANDFAKKHNIPVDKCIEM